MKLNQDKWHFLFSGHKYEILLANERKTKIWGNRQQYLVRNDSDLKFDGIGKFMTLAQRMKIFY